MTRALGPQILTVALAGSLLLAGPLAARAARRISVQEALLRAKPAVALVIAEVSAEVSVDCGSGRTRVSPGAFQEKGTGWFVDSNGLIITNAHVVQPAHTPGRWLTYRFSRRAVEQACLPSALRAQNLVPGERPALEDKVRRRVMGRVLPTAKVDLSPSISVILSNGIRLPARVKKFSPPLSLQEGQISGRDLALLEVEGGGFPALPLANSREAKIGDPLHILGFPGVVLTHELLNQSATVEASVTNGAISGFKQDRSNQPVIQTDAPAAWGNSGGPAVTDRGEVVGVLTMVSLAPGPQGSIVQGFNFTIPSEAVERFVEGTEVRLGAESEFNMFWWAGLRDLFEQRFTQAEKQFEAANALHPNLPDVQRMLAEAEDKIKNPPPRPFPWAWVALGVTLVSLAGFGTIWGRQWWKNRHRILPSEVVRLLEGGQKPLILDVRTESAYEGMPIKIPGSLYFRPDEIEQGVSSIEPDHSRPVLAYCSSPDEATSARVARQLRRLGFKHVKILKGGLGAWANAGLPIEAKSSMSAVGVELYKSLLTGNV